MADTVYVDGVTTMVADSLNDFNRLHYTIFGDPANVAAAKQVVTPAYIYIREEQASGTDSGTFTAGSWQKRVLNTEVNDAGGYASLASSVIALLAGTYMFRGRAPGNLCNSHTLRLANTSDSTYIYGSSENSSVTGEGDDHAEVVGQFTISGTKNFELQHYCQSTSNTVGLGKKASFGVIEVYAEIQFWRLY